MNEPTKTDRPRRRRWFSFRLLSLLIVVTLIGSWLGYHVSRVKQHEAAIGAIQALGGSYTAEISKSTPNWLLSLLGEKYFKSVTSVSFLRTPATDADMRNLEQFPDVQWLILNDTQVTDRGMQSIQNLKKLKWVELNGTNVGDDGIVYFRGCNDLVVLRLVDTRVSLGGIDRIEGTLPGLKELWLPRTVTTAEATSLKKKWPNTTIVYGAGHSL
jgi:hypothetical protein